MFKLHVTLRWDNHNQALSSTLWLSLLLSEVIVFANKSCGLLFTLIRFCFIMQGDNWWANGTHNSVIILFFVYCILLLSLCQGLISVPFFLLYSRSQILYICFDMFHPAYSSAVSNTVLSPCQRHIRVPWSNLWPFQFCKHMTSRLSLAYILTQDFSNPGAPLLL